MYKIEITADTLTELAGKVMSLAAKLHTTAETEPAIKAPAPVADAPAPVAKAPALIFDRDVAPVVLLAVATRGKLFVETVMAEYGVERASQLDASRWPALLERLESPPLMAHAKLSPSGAHRWMACPGSVALEAPFPDQSSSYAAEGTLAHTLASEYLDGSSQHPTSRIHDVHQVGPYVFTVDAAMAAYVDDYIRLVREYAEGALLLVEQRVPIGHITGEEGATGTSDAIIVDTKKRTLSVIDLKYGMGVRVDAGDNPQLMLYALGALEHCDQIGEFDQICMVIHQPRLNHVSEHWIYVGDLWAFKRRAAEAAEATRQPDALLVPGEKQCRFCKAKAVCPALAAEVAEVVSGSATLDEFVSPDMTTGDNYLSVAMSKVDLVEHWCKAVRAEVERRLLAGQTVDGFKLVEGKRGNRKWSSDAEAEALFKSFRLRQDEMYDYSLISPTKAEKLLKDTPKRWEKAEALISRADGKPSVAPATDKRPALAVQSVADDFRDLTAN